MDPRVAARMRTHVTDLASEHGIHLTWVAGFRNAEAFPAARAARVPEIRQPSDYLMALHELGHILSADAQTEDSEVGDYCNVVAEGASWAWASSTALPALARHLRAKDWNRIGYAFRTYLAVGSLQPPASSQECFPGSV